MSTTPSSYASSWSSYSSEETYVPDVPTPVITPTLPPPVDNLRLPSPLVNSIVDGSDYCNVRYTPPQPPDHLHVPSRVHIHRDSSQHVTRENSRDSSKSHHRKATTKKYRPHPPTQQSHSRRPYRKASHVTVSPVHPPNLLYNSILIRAGKRNSMGSGLPPPAKKQTVSREVATANQSMQTRLHTLSAMDAPAELEVVPRRESAEKQVAEAQISKITELLQESATKFDVLGPYKEEKSNNIVVPTISLSLSDLSSSNTTLPPARPPRSPPRHHGAQIKEDLVELNDDEREQLHHEEQEKEIMAYIAKDLRTHLQLMRGETEVVHDLMRQWDHFPVLYPGRAVTPTEVLHRQYKQETASDKRIHALQTKRKKVLATVKSREQLTSTRMHSISVFDTLQRQKYAWQTIILALRGHVKWDTAARHSRAVRNITTLQNRYYNVFKFFQRVSQRRQTTRVSTMCSLFIGVSIAVVGLRRVLKQVMIRRIKWLLGWAHFDRIRALHVFYLRTRAAQRAIRRHLQHRRAQKMIYMLQYQKVEDQFIREHSSKMTSPMAILKLVQKWKTKLRNGEIRCPTPPVIDMLRRRKRSSAVGTPIPSPRGSTGGPMRGAVAAGAAAGRRYSTQSCNSNTNIHHTLTGLNLTVNRKGLTAGSEGSRRSSAASVISNEETRIAIEITVRQTKNRATTNRNFHKLKEKLLRPKPEIKFPPIPTYPPPKKSKLKKNTLSSATTPMTPLTPAAASSMPSWTLSRLRSFHPTTPNVSSAPTPGTNQTFEASQCTMHSDSSYDEWTTEQEPVLLAQYRTPHYTTLKLVVQHLGWKLRRHQKALQQWKIMKDDMLEKRTKMTAAGMYVPPTMGPPRRPHMNVVLPYKDVLRLVLRGLEATAVDYTVGKNSLLLHSYKQKEGELSLMPIDSRKVG